MRKQDLQKVVKNFREKLEQTQGKYQDVLVGDVKRVYPVNGCTGYRYRGTNSLFLRLSAVGRPMIFFGFKQAKKYGYIRKGAKGIPILKPYYRKTVELCDKCKDSGVMAENCQDCKESERIFYIITYVFNIEDVVFSVGDVKKQLLEKYWVQNNGFRDDFVETIRGKFGVEVRVDDAERPHYHKGWGYISLPSEEKFRDNERFRFTLLHELAHALVDRDGNFGKVFKRYDKGTDFLYSVEEIVANLVAMEFYGDVENELIYIKGFYKKIKGIVDESKVDNILYNILLYAGKLIDKVRDELFGDGSDK